MGKGSAKRLLRRIGGEMFGASGPKHRKKRTAQRMADRVRAMSGRKTRVIPFKDHWRVFVGNRRKKRK